MNNSEPLDLTSALHANRRHYDDKLNSILVLLQETMTLLQNSRLGINHDDLHDALEKRISEHVSNILSEKLTVTNERLSDVLTLVKSIAKKE